MKIRHLFTKMSAKDFAEFLENECSFELTLSEYLNILLKRKGRVRSRTVKLARINDTFGYQIFLGN